MSTRSGIAKKAGSSAGISLSDIGDAFEGALPDQEVTISTDFGDLIFSRSIKIAAEKLMDNPANNRPIGSERKLKKMGERMDKVGLLNPLLVRPFQDGDPSEAKFFDKMIIAGHRRKQAILKYSERITSPDCRVLKHPIPLPHDLEILIFDVENEDRREDFENANQKKAWIRKDYGKRILKSKHGGTRRGKANPGGNLAEEIAEASGGSVSVGTAKRYIAEIRRELEEDGVPNENSKRKTTSKPSNFQMAKQKLTKVATLLRKTDEKFAIQEIEKLTLRFEKRLKNTKKK